MLLLQGCQKDITVLYPHQQQRKSINKHKERTKQKLQTDEIFTSLGQRVCKAIDRAPTEIEEDNTLISFK